MAPDTGQGVNLELNTKLQCTEQYPFAPSAADVKSTLQEAGLPRYQVDETIERIQEQGGGCDAWESAMTAPTPTDFGDYPVLILSGSFDPLTLPTYAQIAADELPNAQLVKASTATHSVLGNYGDCVAGITAAFLAEPDQDVDAGCTDSMTLDWVAPEVELPTGK